VNRKTLSTGIVLLLVTLQLPLADAREKGEKKDKDRVRVNVETSSTSRAVLWHDPADITTRDLYYGPGGKKHAPNGTFTFVKEDLNGTNPKFDVVDGDGVKWKVKLGIEARPETVVSRIVWAVGYSTNEDYFMRDLRVDGMPAHLRRGQKLVDSDGSMHNVRLKRESKGEKKIGTWQWRDDPFLGSRELSGLKVLMALVNNWDLKDENNAIYQDGSERVFMVSDLGASFGSAGRAWPKQKAKDNFDSYSRSKFIRRETPEFVDFQVPARPQWEYLVNPREYLSRVHLESIGRNIPRADARWMGQLLARLSQDQIRDAFRASGYSPQEVEQFSKVLEQRIAVLTSL
jgi:hypothetical protein